MNCTATLGTVCGDPNCPTHGLELYRQGYQAGFAAGRKSAGQPNLAPEQCPGGGKKPVGGLVKLKSNGHPGRGVCSSCGTEFKLTWPGYVRRHRKKKS